MIKVLAIPAFGNKSNNPYNWLLYTHLQKKGVKVIDFSSKTPEKIKILLKKYDIFHLHWPESLIDKKSTIRALKGIGSLMFIIVLMKLRGSKIIWTAHNLMSHEKRRPFLEKIHWIIFTNILDGYIVLTKAGIKDLRLKHPALRKKPVFLTIHGHYREFYANNLSKEQSRKILKIDKNKKVYLFLGKIAIYKNIPLLIETFNKIKDKQAILYLAGKINNKNLEKEILSEIKSERIILNSDFIKEEDIQIYLKSSDIVVLPYRDILNSGTLFLALSFNKPVLVPETNTFKEIQNQVGKNWIKTYRGELNSKILKESLNWALKRKNDQLNLEKFNWDNIAEETKKAYLEVISNGK